ncbi:MAG: GreA/GreB family elongation factor [Pseudomonadota bacterium]
MEVSTLERTLTELDHVRLLNLLRRDTHGADHPADWRLIEELLDGCITVPSREVPADVVTMYSQVRVRDRATGRQHTLAPCWPADAEPLAGFVSVLSPIGSALLGLRVGSVARWASPTGEEMAAEILAILFQPEASGDYTT